ncbi:M1 family metallopeptidase [Nocardioides ferulae]|uniref:M1 family metallopeptidase n=1 Tax=Nocardioides ferulae TaxID=2340821 RepID=UPI000EB5235F|nr:M1 family metallopeptidase [Nocardioides ferulae]
MTRRRAARAALAALTATAVAGALAGCSDGEPSVSGPATLPTSTAATASPPATGSTARPAPTADVDPDLAVAVNEPVEDSVYPEVGEPDVDALHYDLALDWAPDTATLEATQTLTFRAATTGDSFQLDLAEPLEVSTARLDGRDVEVRHDGDDLVVRAAVETGEQYALELAYAGSPEPVPAPTTRSDFSTLGWTVTADGEAWTMQEPYGAHSWYAVNDHPSDKALYDFTITTDAPFVGVANGELTSRRTRNGRTETRWHLAEPAASYLITVAVGDYQRWDDESPSGVPISYWVPRDETRWQVPLSATPEALRWVEGKLGDYPFDTLGVLLVDSRSGMETQTMITLGTTRYATSPEVLVHEIVHHWWGNQVTPNDWRDLWMNEGMAMYLQWVYEAEVGGQSIDAVIDRWVPYEQSLRALHGPPGDFDPDSFGESNVYFGGGMLWHAVRQRVGDDAFWDAASGWPASRDNGHAGRDELIAWWEERTGESLRDLFDAWLTSPTSPELE